MPRRRVAGKRAILPDPIYKSDLIAKFTNHLMMEGKKSLAQKILYKALEQLVSRTKQDAIASLEKVLNNVSPIVEVKARRVGGATYQVPVEVRPARRMALAIRWLINASRKRSEKGMIARLSAEFWDAFQNRGFAIKKREEMEKMAAANQAFAHYRW